MDAIGIEIQDMTVPEATRNATVNGIVIVTIDETETGTGIGVGMARSCTPHGVDMTDLLSHQCHPHPCHHRPLDTHLPSIWQLDIIIPLLQSRVPLAQRGSPFGEQLGDQRRTGMTLWSRVVEAMADLARTEIIVVTLMTVGIAETTKVRLVEVADTIVDAREIDTTSLEGGMIVINQRVGNCLILFPSLFLDAVKPFCSCSRCLLYKHSPFV